MNCLDCEDRISDYIEGLTDPATQAAIADHLAVCSSCAHLAENVRSVVSLSGAFPVYEPPPWLPARILANTPRIQRETWTATIAAGWRWISDPRTALGAFTAVLVLGWMGSLAGVQLEWGAIVRNPAAIYYEAQGAVNRAYDEALRRYYRSQVVNEIRTRIEQIREIS